MTDLLTPSHRRQDIANATVEIDRAITEIVKKHDITDGELLRILSNEIRSLDMRNPRRKRNITVL